MATTSRPEAASEQELDLQPSPHWGSSEQSRVNGVDGLLTALQEDQVGTLDVKQGQFVLQAGAFQRPLGLTRDADRLSHSLHALLDAIALTPETGGLQAGLEHVRPRHPDPGGRVDSSTGTGTGRAGCGDASRERGVTHAPMEQPW